MNAMFHEKSLSLESVPLNFYWSVTIGATGAPTITRARGLKSITRTSAGLYVLTLSQPCQVFLAMNCEQLLASGLPASPYFAVSAQQVNNASPTITVQFSAPSGTSGALVATEVDSGAVLYFRLTVNNSSAI